MKELRHKVMPSPNCDHVGLKESFPIYENAVYEIKAFSYLKVTVTVSPSLIFVTFEGGENLYSFNIGRK